MDPAYSQDLPTGWVCLVFIILFGLSICKDRVTAVALEKLTIPPLVSHLVQSIYTKAWWLLPTAVLSGLFATLGWTSRLLVAQKIGGESPYYIQYVAFYDL